VDAERAAPGAAAENGKDKLQSFDDEVKEIAPQTKPEGDNWRPGSGPSQVLSWAVRAVAKAGTVSIIGVYPQSDHVFPIGEAMNRNLVLRMGNCNHRAITPHLVELVSNGSLDPLAVLTQREPIADAISAYRASDLREPGWIKIKLKP
jgi:threonine dehydrogenase-like Zn-dependent dehydrogenase